VVVENAAESVPSFWSTDDQPRTRGRVCAHLVEFGVGERAGLSEQLGWEQELADVVQQAPRANGPETAFLPPESFCDRQREAGDALRVATRPGMRLLDRLGQLGQHGRQSSRLPPASLPRPRK
jgi:hypothetical protein